MVSDVAGQDYIVQLRVKNGPMLRAMRRAGHFTAASLSRASGVDQQSLGKFLNLTRPAIDRRTGDWSAPVVKIAECLGVMPVNLFPSQHLEAPLQKNTGEAEMSLDEVRSLPRSLQRSLENHTPEDDLIEGDVSDAIRETLGILTDREQRVLSLRFGLDGQEHTSKEVAELEGISPARAWQIERRALRKMKAPTMTSPIIKAGYQPTGSRRNAGEDGWRPDRAEGAMPPALGPPKKSRGPCPCGDCADSLFIREAAVERLSALRSGGIEVKVVPPRSTR